MLRRCRRALQRPGRGVRPKPDREDHHPIPLGVVCGREHARLAALPVGEQDHDRHSLRPPAELQLVPRHLHGGADVGRTTRHGQQVKRPLNPCGIIAERQRHVGSPVERHDPDPVPAEIRVVDELAHGADGSRRLPGLGHRGRHIEQHVDVCPPARLDRAIGRKAQRDLERPALLRFNGGRRLDAAHGAEARLGDRCRGGIGGRGRAYGGGRIALIGRADRDGGTGRTGRPEDGGYGERDDRQKRRGEHAASIEIGWRAERVGEHSHSADHPSLMASRGQAENVRGRNRALRHDDAHGYRRRSGRSVSHRSRRNANVRSALSGLRAYFPDHSVWRNPTNAPFDSPRHGPSGSDSAPAARAPARLCRAAPGCPPPRPPPPKASS